jgi:hypothetical protein
MTDGFHFMTDEIHFMADPIVVVNPDPTANGPALAE